MTVVDNTPPVISGPVASPSMLWPPNHDMVDVTVNYEATDNCAVLERWLSVSSNEPGSSSDWEVLVAHHVRLRAARSARWGERLYTITITAKDIHGNLSTQNVTVRVPQSKGEGRHPNGDIATNTIIATIPVEFRPSGIVITPDSARVYVANSNSGTVSVIGTATNTVIDTIPAAMGVFALAITSDGAKIYATNGADSTVTVIATSTNTVTSVIPLRQPSNPSYLAVTSDDARVYVANGPDTVTINEFDVIDTATDTLTTVIPNPDNCSHGIAMAPLVPHTKDDCKNGGYLRFRSLAFPNQGQCIKYVENHVN